MWTVNRSIMKVLQLVVALVMVASSASAAPRSATAVRIDRVEIAFLYEDGRDYEEYTAIAAKFSDVTSGDVLSVRVHAGIRPCSLDDEGALTCEGDLAARRVIRFDTSNDMSQAFLAFRDAAGGTSRITLHGGDPYNSSGRSVPNECGGATVHHYEYAFNARARGTMFGREVKTTGDADPEAESMTRYVQVKTCP